MFIGYHGRKGPKKDPALMGSTMKFMTLNTKVPMFVVNYHILTLN